MKILKLSNMALIAIVLIFNLIACSDDNEISPTLDSQEPPIITIDEEILSKGLVFSDSGGEKTINFTTNTNWTLNVSTTTSGSTWCSPSSTNGEKGSASVTFVVDENREYEDRSVSVTIQADTVKQTFVITQKNKEAILLTTDKYEINQSGGIIDVEVKSNIDYQTEIGEMAKDWIIPLESRSLISRKHSFQITPNENYNKREGEIYFKSGDKIETVKVYQSSGAVLMLTKDEVIVSDKGETVAVEIKSNFEYGIKMPDVDWIIDEATTRGLSSHTLKYTILPNESYDTRSAQIVYFDKNGDLKDTLTILQAQKDAIILSLKELKLGPAGGMLEVAINSNTDVEVKLPQIDWIQERTYTRGLTKSYKYFTISSNNGITERKAEIIFTNKKQSISETLKVQQGAQSLSDYQIEIETAGTLSNIIPDEIKNNITTLTISGSLNSDDIRYIREMAGRDVYGEATSGTLSTLNMSNARIVSGGESYYIENNQGFIFPYNTENDVIGVSFFENCNLQSVDLPRSVLKVLGSAFYKCTQLTKITIPDQVSTIWFQAFAGCSNLNFIKLPNSLTELGDFAFSSSGLVNVTLPNSIKTLPTGLFYDCPNLSYVSLPESVNSIPSTFFARCTNLRTFTMPDNIIFTDQSIFSGCSNLQNITLSNNLATIGDFMFQGCNSLREVVFPQSVYNIGSLIFLDCHNITTITCQAIVPPYLRDILIDASYPCTIYVPKGCVDAYKQAEGWRYLNIAEIESPYKIHIEEAGSLSQYIGEYEKNAISSLTVSGNLNGDDIRFLREMAGIDYSGKATDGQLKHLDMSNAHIVSGGGIYYYTESRNYHTQTDIFGEFFFAESNLVSIKLPQDIKQIEVAAMTKCRKLTNVIIPSSVEIINGNAFSNCSQLSEISIPSGGKAIKGAAFWNCRNLTKVSLPSSLAQIDNYVFQECYNLAEIYCYSETPPVIQDETFKYVNLQNCLLYVPSMSIGMYQNDTYWQKFKNITSI